MAGMCKKVLKRGLNLSANYSGSLKSIHSVTVAGAKSKAPSSIAAAETYLT